ncbi:unnamed protein product [Linum tenue]|nr:unnamed protein product [Linum tenue]
MDVGRSVLVQSEPRTRLDAGTWGTMGVGLGYCIAAAVAEPDRLVVAVEGDSGFGFSAMEVEVEALSHHSFSHCFWFLCATLVFTFASYQMCLSLCLYEMTYLTGVIQYCLESLFRSLIRVIRFMCLITL